jgi:hypothetical protein
MAGPAHGRLPEWSLSGWIMTGLAPGCLPKRLLLGGTTADLALLESSSWHGSSEPLHRGAFIEHHPWCPVRPEHHPRQRLFGASTQGLAPRVFPLADPPRRS